MIFTFELKFLIGVALPFNLHHYFNCKICLFLLSTGEYPLHGHVKASQDDLMLFLPYLKHALQLLLAKFFDSQGPLKVRGQKPEYGLIRIRNDNDN